MKYPKLVPDKVCTTNVRIVKTGGLNRDGSPKETEIFNGKCFHDEKSFQKLNADKQLITLSGKLFLNGDIAPDSDIISGNVEIEGSKEARIINSSYKGKNPDGTVNYTMLELI